MNKLKFVGLTAIVGAQMSNQDWMFLISIVLTVLGMLQDYLGQRKKEPVPPQ